MTAFYRWQMHAEIPSAIGAWEVYWRDREQVERRRRFVTEEEAERFAAKMCGRVEPVKAKARHSLGQQAAR